MSTNPAALSTVQACQVLSLGKTKLFELLATGQIKGFNVGRKRLIPQSEIERFIAARMQEAQR